MFMKRLTLIVAAILLCASSFAQKKNSTGKNGTTHSKPGKKTQGRCPVVFLNASTGLNNNLGMLGVGADLAFASQGSVDMGIGLGTWGQKAYIGGKYYMKPCHAGWAFGGGLTYATGNNNFKYNLETVYGTTQLVTLQLEPMANVFIAAYKYWSVGRRANRFYLELGWSHRLLLTTFTQTAGDPLSDNSVKTVNALSPGGLIIGTGFCFGIPRNK